MGSIIHVDNSEFYRKLMKSYLSELNMETISFESGKEALEEIKNGTSSCVITGLELTDMKGEDFIRQISALNKNIPIIIYSSNADEEQTKELKTYGVIGMVQKTSNWKEELRKYFI